VAAARTQVEHETDWGPITGPTAAGCAAFLLGLFGHHGMVPWWLPGLFAAIGVAGATSVGLHRRTRYRNIAYRVGCWTLAGLWTMAAIGWGWWGGPWILVLICGGLMAGFLSVVFGPHAAREDEEDPDDADGPTAAETVLTSEERYWRNLIIARMNKDETPPETIKVIRNWDGGTGLTLYGEWAEGSPRGWEDARDMQLQLARAARLPPGCPITAAPAMLANVPPELGLRIHQGAWIMRIPKVNAGIQMVDFPADYSPISVRDVFPIGFHMDGRPTLIELYQAAGLIVGRRGSGKTVLLHDITAQCHRMTDCIVIHVDLNGGKLIGPWITPYARGLVNRPTVELVAFTPRQALKLSRILLKIAKDRNLRYQPLMIAEDVDIIPVSEDLPKILVIIDEGGLVTGENATREAKQAALNFKELQSIGRAVLVDVLFSVQRGTSDFIPSALKKGTSLGICGKVKDLAELASVFDWGKGIKVEDLIYTGQFFIQRDDDEDSGGAVEIFKTFRLMPKQIGEIAVATEQLRPYFDQAALDIGGDVFRTWWDQPIMRWYLAMLRGEDPGPEPEDMPLDDDDLAAGVATGDPLAEADALIAEANAMLDKSKDAHTAPKSPPARPARPVETPKADQPPPSPATVPAAGGPEDGEEWAERLRAELDALPTVDEPPLPGQAGPAGQEEPGTVQTEGEPVSWPVAVQARIREIRRRPPETALERRTAMVRILAAAGPDGMQTHVLVRAVQRAGMPVTRGTVSEWLKAEKSDGRVDSPRQGIWAATEKGQAA
jgi:hypothetical protein